MSLEAGFELTSKQRQVLERLLAEFDPDIEDRGRDLFMADAVKSLRVKGTTLLADVMGTNLYTVSIPVKDEFSCVCTCPYEFDCKHAAAAIFAALESSAMPLTTPDPSNSGGGSFTEVISARFGKKPSKGAFRALHMLARWWSEKKSTASSSELMELAHGTSYWGLTQQEELYPERHPPKDEIEYLGYVLLAARRQQQHLPADLERVADHDTLLRLQKLRERELYTERWRRALGTWKEPAVQAESLPELRLVVHASGAAVQARLPGQADFAKTTQKLLKQMWGGSTRYGGEPHQNLPLPTKLVLKAALYQQDFCVHNIPACSEALNRSLLQLLELPGDAFATHVVGESGLPLVVHATPLRWRLMPPPPDEPEGDYTLMLVDAQERVVQPPVALTDGVPRRYFTPEGVHALDRWPFDKEPVALPMHIPAAALESREGVQALRVLRLPLPPAMAGRVRVLRPEIEVRCRILRHQATDFFLLRAQYKLQEGGESGHWNGETWLRAVNPRLAADPKSGEIIETDRTLTQAVTGWLAQRTTRPATLPGSAQWVEERVTGKDWPEEFLAWLARRPKGVSVELDPDLMALTKGPVAGKVRLDIEESKTGIDWFDLSVALEVSDTTLTQEEIDLLLKAKGRWVRLAGKGWRRLEFQLSEEQNRELAELGIAVNDFSAEKQALHALQLGGMVKKGSSLLAGDRVEQVRRRVEDIHTRVTPPLPSHITATLRPYQMEGFHFLAYLTVNRFGGVLADDMGLGKTLQTLAWIAWLRETQNVRDTALVVCPKSVQGNWRAEAAKFFPALRVEVWTPSTAAQTGLGGSCDLLVIHYAQLRLHEEALRKQRWSAIVLDEAQAIKNPESQNARIASALAQSVPHRLALTGTPIENRLLDLWSIFAFAMPGVLGNRASFTRNFDGKDDPLARRRLAARTRPFLLRRTKNEVARDLPERIEEDRIVELEGTQAALYQAELKRARAQLLKAGTSKQLDQMRFHILTSLLRLRQICCDPRLVGLETAAALKKKAAAATSADSAKLTALLEQLEPLIEDGQKVLVFSQFIDMLGYIEAETTARGWPTYKLTGQTEQRDELVAAFQNHAGAAVFLISLKAGGFGLNLTAASYVVLYDPWWNPAVEAQAIDRTHRIGQQQTVIAYRMLAQGTIEEKIRQLQKQKGQLASDILGEESFAQALTLDDFKFLLGDDVG